MKNFKAIEDNQVEFWEGKQNIFVRLVTYAKVGLTQVNDYKYVGALVFGVYYTFKLSNPWWLLIMGVISLPLLIFLGRWWLHKGAKSSEFVTTQKGTVVGYNQYNSQIKIIELLEKIYDILSK